MKSTIAARGLSLYICLILGLSASLLSSCAKERKGAPVRAMTTFVIGTVVLERPGEPVRPIRHKEELKQGDVVKTGPDSMLVVQIGEESVIKIESGTTLAISQLLIPGDKQFNLEQGRMFTRVRHLGKEATFRVYTKTSLAAVRGTEFSVTAERNRSVVAVNDGTVAVRKIDSGKEAAEEKEVPRGTAVVVTGAITTRPINAEEKKEFNRFARIEAVEDLDGTSESDLRKMEEDYRKNKDRPVDAGGDREKDRKEEKSAEKDKAAENDAAKKTALWTSKGVYGASDPVIVYYRNMPEYRNCWIDVSKASDGDGRYQSYQWTYSAKNGQMTFSNLGLEPGVYEVRAHFSRSSSVDKRYRFRVR